MTQNTHIVLFGESFVTCNVGVSFGTCSVYSMTSLNALLVMCRAKRSCDVPILSSVSDWIREI